MKTLIVSFIILGILFLYFIAGAERSLIIKNDEVMPKGINIPEFLTNKVKELGLTGGLVDSNLTGGNLGSTGFVGNAVNSVKDLTSKAVNNIGDMIKSPIQNKIQEIICPATK